MTDNTPRGAAAAIPPDRRRPLPGKKTRTVPSLLAELDPSTKPPPYMAPPEIPKARPPQKVYRRGFDLERCDPRLLKALDLIKEVDRRLAKAEHVLPQAMLAFCAGVRGPVGNIRRHLKSLVEAQRKEGSFEPELNPHHGRRAASG